MKWLAGSVNYHKDANPWERLKRMLSRLPCPTINAWFGGPHTQVALAVCSPVLPGSSCPVVVDSGSHVLVADIELHNRTDLRRQLASSGRPVGEDVSDERLLLEAYITWGKECPRHIVGEFAFVIWDQARRGMFAARDQMGSRSLFYRPTPAGLEVASDALVLGFPASMNDLNPEYFVRFHSNDGHPDDLLTPYRGVYRLPKAHWLWVDPDGTEMRRYWSLLEQLGLPEVRTQEDCAEQFDALLREAVRCRLSSGINAISLSGGLDSTAIFAYAKELEARGECGPIIPISLTFDRFRGSDERFYIQPVLDMYRTKPCYEPGDECVAFKGFPEDVPWHDEPRVGMITYSFLHAIASRSRREGAVRLLTGMGGDQVLSGTPLCIADQIRSGRWFSAMRAAWQYSRQGRFSIAHGLWAWGIGPLWGRGDAILYGESPQNYGGPARLRWHQRELDRQFTTTPVQLRTDREIAVQEGLSFSHPFFDRRIWEFLFRVPGELLWRGGVTKNLLRKVMHGRLPDNLLQRGRKTDNHDIIFEGIRRYWPALWSVAKACRVSRLGLVKDAEFLDALTAFRQGHNVRPDVWVLLTLEYWLHKAERRTGTTLPWAS